MNIRDYHYRNHKQLLEHHPCSDALIMAAYRQGVSWEQDLLAKAFPQIIQDLLECQLLELRGPPLDQHLVPEVREPGPEEVHR